MKSEKSFCAEVGTSDSSPPGEAKKQNSFS
jgi:hypothetical protein